LATSESAATKTQLVWARQFGTTENDFVHRIERCNGAIYVVGRTNGGLGIPTISTPEDAFIRKYDLNGTVVWTRQFGDSDDDAVNDVACDASGIYITGATEDSLGNDQMFVRKLDHSTGEELWSSTTGMVGISAAGIAVDSTGVYVVGALDGAFSGETSAGGRDAFVKKLELGTAQTIWTRQFGTTEADFAAGVFVDPTGVYVMGSTAGVFDGQQSQGGSDEFVRKYDLNGTAVLWTRQFGTSTNDNPNGIAGDGTGFYVGADASPNGFVRRFNRAGDLLWAQSFTGSVFNVAADDTGAYVSGAVLGALLVRKYDPRGRVSWSHRFEVDAVSFLSGIAADRTGVYLGGVTFGTIAEQTNIGGFDGFLAKLAVSVGPSKTR
jgi:hypothetical protein